MTKDAGMVSPGVLRGALAVHGLYFICWGVIFDFFVGAVASALHLPEPQTVIGWVATDIASGELLSLGMVFLLASLQTHLPRFILVAAIIQTAYNLYHDVVWFAKGYPFGLVLLDTVLIGTLFTIYVMTWRTAKGLNT